MSRKAPILLGMLLVWLVAHAPAVRAANPKVTLHVENATGPEVARALTDASGEVITWKDPADPNRPPERASFDWKQAPLSQALTEVGQHFQVHIARGLWGNGFDLVSRPQTESASDSREGLVEAQGYRISVVATSVEVQSEVALARPGQKSQATLKARIAVDVPGGDGQSVSRIESVVAWDDLGHELREHAQIGRPDVFVTRPDQCQQEVTLDGWDPRARKLVKLVGELRVFPHLRSESVAVPIPIPADWQSRPIAGGLLEKVQLNPPDGAPGQSPRFSASITMASTPDLEATSSGRQVTATLILASGAVARQTDGSSGSGWDGEKTLNWSIDAAYPALPEQVAPH